MSSSTINWHATKNIFSCNEDATTEFYVVKWNNGENGLYGLSYYAVLTSVKKNRHEPIMKLNISLSIRKFLDMARKIFNPLAMLHDRSQRSNNFCMSN